MAIKEYRLPVVVYLFPKAIAKRLKWAIQRNTSNPGQIREAFGIADPKTFTPETRCLELNSFPSIPHGSCYLFSTIFYRDCRNMRGDGYVSIGISFKFTVILLFLFIKCEWKNCMQLE